MYSLARHIPHAGLGNQVCRCCTFGHVLGEKSGEGREQLGRQVLSAASAVNLAHPAHDSWFKATAVIKGGRGLSGLRWHGDDNGGASNGI